MPKSDVDPKLAQDIENDIDEIDGNEGETNTQKQTVKGEPCPDCADNLIGPGLLDAHTICPTCEGTGKVAVLE